MGGFSFCGASNVVCFYLTLRKPFCSCNAASHVHPRIDGSNSVLHLAQLLGHPLCRATRLCYDPDITLPSRTHRYRPSYFHVLVD